MSSDYKSSTQSNDKNKSKKHGMIFAAWKGHCDFQMKCENCFILNLQSVLSDWGSILTNSNSFPCIRDFRVMDPLEV